MVYVLGCGGNCKIVIDICKANNIEVQGIYDDKYEKEIVIYENIKLIGKIEDVLACSVVINSIGTGKIRKLIFERLKRKKLFWLNCIHPNVTISDTVKLGEGNVICNGVIINSDTQIGNYNLINTCAIIEHDCKIGDFNDIAPRSTICGTVTLKDLNFLGVSSTIIQNINLESNITIGAMGLVIRDIKESGTYVGIPVKKINK